MNQAEELAEKIRQHLGKHNDPELSISQCVIALVAKADKPGIEMHMFKTKTEDLERSVKLFQQAALNAVRNAIVSIEEGNEDEAIATLKELLGE